MLLSILIPAYNEAEMLPNTLEKLKEALQQASPPGLECEIIVCNNCSTDGTAEVAKALGASVVYEPIRQISRARNTAAEVAKGTWYMFLDADTYPLPAMMKEVFAGMENERVVGLGSTVKVYDGSIWNRLRMERLNPSMRLLKWSGGAFLMARSEAFHAIGGFSEDLFALEEIDFVVRLKRYGRKQKMKFSVLHKYPVMTSGRKGDHGFRSFFSIFLSTTASLFFLVCYLVLPRRWRLKGSRKLLGYWYHRN